MTRNVITGSADDKISDVMGWMTEMRIRHLPVLEKGQARWHGLDRRYRQGGTQPVERGEPVLEALHPELTAQSRRQLSDDPLHDTCRPVSGSTSQPTGTTADGFIGKSFGGEQALQLPPELIEFDLLTGGLRLASLARGEPAQSQRGAKAFGELGRVEHRIEQQQQSILQIASGVELAGDASGRTACA